MEEEEAKKSGIGMLRQKLKEWTTAPYMFQMFNVEEARSWYNPNSYTEKFNEAMIEFCKSSSERYKSFDFSINEPMIVGKVKHCSYSELGAITNFKNPSVIQETVSGRLLHGTIVQGSEERQAVVKTWDFILPMRTDGKECLDRFCEEIELFTDERVNSHPNLVKLYTYCVDTRLAVVFDEKFTGQMLSDVLPADDFGWDERMKVATQLADLFSCLHENKIVLGCVTALCIMIDEKMNAKVFDFGYVTNSLNVNPILVEQPRAPELLKGEKTMKSDVFMFGFLLLELMAKKKFTFMHSSYLVEKSVRHEAELSNNNLVHEIFREVDDSTAKEITRLVLRCMNFESDKRPTMKDVLDALNAMRSRGWKRKRDENEAEQNKR